VGGSKKCGKSVRYYLNGPLTQVWLCSKEWPLAPNSRDSRVTHANLSRRVTFFSKMAFGECWRVLASVGESGESAQHGSANVGESGESLQTGLAKVGESGKSQHQNETRRRRVREYSHEYSQHFQNSHLQNSLASCHCLLCSQTWANGYLWIMITCLQRRPLERPNFNFYNIYYLWTTTICHQWPKC
jgi:hypothetical protein